ncbi:MAG: MSHA biogenesis protein MshI [Burkholderiaceae bacterium]|nr:MSHA biogenesis protein MshI [Burkholderiaceae bacterium]
MSQQINLFNPRFRKQTNYFNATAIAAGLAVVLAGSLAAGLMARQRVTTVQAEADQVAAQLKAIEARKTAAGVLTPRQKSAALQQELAQVESDNRALQEVAAILEKGEVGNTRGYSGYFTALARIRVQGLWLTGVQIAGPGNEIGLQGRTVSAGLLPAYLHSLAREPVLKGKTFGHLEIGQPKPAAQAAGTADPVAAAVVAASGAAAAAAANAPAPYVEFSLQAAPGGAAAKGDGK